MERTDEHYRSIAKNMLRRIEALYGKDWRKCLSADVQRELCAAQAFYLMLSSVDGSMPAERLERHGTAAYNALLQLLNLEE